MSKLPRQLILTLMFFVIAALAPVSLAAGETKPVNVVASFTVLADIASQIGGDYVEVTSIVGVNGDAHVYRARPADAKKIVNADLLVINGLGFEGWLERLVQSSGFKGQKVVATDGLDALSSTEKQTSNARKLVFGDHSHVNDPHAWHSLKNGVYYAQSVTGGLIAVDPKHADYFTAQLNQFKAKAERLDSQLKQMISTLPEQNRRVITTHDAFAYLGKEYGLEFISPQNVSTESEASARDVALLIREIREQNINAVFLENISDDRLMNQIAEETGAKIGGTLYSGALSDQSGPASTYLGMVEHNITTLVEALSAP